MEKLRNTIEKYGRWNELATYIDRIEAYVVSDFSLSLENAKALLESISREICDQQGVELSSTATTNTLLKKAFFAIGYEGNNLVTQISTALSTIGQKMGDLRNEIGVTSHGKSLNDLKERNKRVDEITKEFLLETTVIVACFLINSFENENPRASKKDVEKKLSYKESETFNEFWDETFGEFEMGSYSYPASEILYNTDYLAYETEYREYIEGDE